MDAVNPRVDPSEFPGHSQDQGQATLASHNHVHQLQGRSSNLHGLQPAHVKSYTNLHLHQDHCDTVIPSLQAVYCI